MISIYYYDIQKIIAMIDDNKHIYKNYKIYLVVPDKKKVLDKVKTANNSSNYITKYMTEENILDIDHIKKNIIEIVEDNIFKLIDTIIFGVTIKQFLDDTNIIFRRIFSRWISENIEFPQDSLLRKLLERKLQKNMVEHIITKYQNYVSENILEEDFVRVIRPRTQQWIRSDLLREGSILIMLWQNSKNFKEKEE